MRVVVALSGGVDSAVAGLRLVEAGHDVVAVHLRLADSPPQRAGHGCCGLDDAQDARRTAQQLGVPFHVWDLREVFAAQVVDRFVARAAAGLTDHPCVTCNQQVKVAAVLARTRALGFDALATGHHARVVHTDDGARLLRGADRAKDQSYVLHVHGPDDLADLRTPIGAMTKPEVRAAAAAAGLRVASKPDSYDLCFVPDGDTPGWLDDRLEPAPGEVVDLDGAVLGTHQGIWRTTVGQRRGLGISHHERRFVVDVDAQQRRVLVGPRGALACRWLDVPEPTWTRGHAPTGPVRVQVRAHGASVPGRVDGARVTLDEPLYGVALGQSAVCYDPADRECLGGGVIAAAQRPVLPLR